MQRSMKRKRSSVAKISRTKVQRLSESWANDSWDNGEELVSNSDATDSEVDPELEDEGEESGEEGMDAPLGDGVDVEGQLSSPRKEGDEKLRKKSGLYQPPTHEELQTLKETQDLFKSNLMRLQITELLAEMKPKKTPQKLDELLHSLRTTLTTLPSSKQVDLCTGLHLLPPRVKYPLPLDPSTVKGRFHFLPPQTVKVVGSYLLGTMTKPHLNVDLALYIPEDCLQAKDHLNYRYFHKRALYLSIVAGYLRKKKKTCGLHAVEFSLAGGNPLLPILVLTPKEQSLSKYRIRLHISIPESSHFKLTKLGPDRNNVRRSALTQLSSEASDHQCDPEPDSPLPPTPHYNAAILREQGAMERHLHDLYAAMQECPVMVDAVVLCKVWVKQRGLNQGLGGFTGFHFAMLMAMLLQQKQLNKFMSSYQILRILLQHLATRDWTLQGISLAKPDPALPPLLSFHSSFDVVFLDSSGYHNLCAGTSKDRFRHLQHEASLSMRCLDDPTIDGFEAVFMKPVPFVHKFDALCHIVPSSVFQSSVTDLAAREAILLDGAAWSLPLVLRRVLPVLHRGLGERVELMVALPSEEQQWLVTRTPPDPTGGHVTLGLLLDTENAFSILDMGPPADSSEAAEFRSFWGEKSELRRFQDGSINEAVVWEGRSVGERRAVCLQVIRYLLERHAGISPECVTCSTGVLDPLLSLPSYLEERGGSVVCTGEEVGKGVCEVFTELSKDLRQLKDLPLAITSLQGTSPVFRHAEVFPPLPSRGRLSRKLQATPTEDVQSECFYPSCEIATPTYTPALEVVCQLEFSGKWPDEVEAVEGIKTAFYIHLARAFREQQAGVASPTPHYLDVFKDGYVFRLRIHYHRETTLLREKISMTTGSETKRLQEQISQMEHTLVSLPLHTSTFHGLHQQYPAFGTGVRLCKRWVSAHLLSNHVTDEAVELMVAHLFTCPAPYSIPGSPLCVLLRFLSLLTTHDWPSEPLIVNFNKELSAADISEVTSKFTADRSRLPSLFIATPYNNFSSPWTTPSPSPPVFSCLKLLAKESLAVLSQQLSTPKLTQVDFKHIFRTPLQDYSVLIHLHQRHLPLLEQGVDVTMATRDPAHKTHTHRMSRTKCSHLPVVDFNPAQRYLRELEGAFSEFALFFYDKYGGTFIAVVWKPAAFVPQPFKVMHAHCRTSVEESSGQAARKCLLVPDVQTIVSDFKLMGEGLVKSVQVLSGPPSNT